jgi:CheY-like chemotaxis protein
MVKKRILIVEDEPIIALDFEKMIEEMGYVSLGKFREGSNALKLIKSKKPDLILLDINLNDGISGYEIAEELIEAKIPFVVITGSSDAVSLKEISKMNANGVLIKPIYQAEFKNTLKSILGNNHSG